MTRGPTGGSSDREAPRYRLVAGFTAMELLVLPEAQQQVAEWLGTQASASMAEIAAFLRQSESATEALVAPLVEQGIVEAIVTERRSASTESRVGMLQFARRRRALPDSLERRLTAKPIAAILSSAGNSAAAGESFELNVTVFNKGDRSALIDIFIDETAQTLRQWCTSSRERLALDPNQNGDVSFHFDIPATALPEMYEYSLVVDAPADYPEDTPILYPQRLQVLPSIEEVTRISDPTFSVQPLTTSTAPGVLQTGEPFELQVEVYNCSNRVDRFRLSCPDLPNSWVSVRYPEGLTAVGNVVEVEGLELNPGERGTIVLEIAPPADSLAGSYFPSIRIYSANNPDLMLLDVVYLKVLPIYALGMELRSLRSRVKRSAGRFSLYLNNQGNIGHLLKLRAKGDEDDGDNLCAYELEQDEVDLPPRTEANVELRVRPKQRWRRPWFGGGWPIPFTVDLEERQQLPLPVSTLPGTLVWAPRPWWQVLAVVLIVLGAIAALILLIWLLFFKPPPMPGIQDFYSSTSTYQAERNEVVRLSWKVRNPKRLSSLSLVGKSAEEGSILSQPVSYDFSQGDIPEVLQPFCSQTRSRLVCHNVQTDARKPGDYIFTLSAFAAGKEEPSSAVETSTIQVLPPLPPKIVEFRSSQPRYPAVVATDPPPADPGEGVDGSAPPSPLGIRLNWKVAHAGQLQALQLVGRDLEGAVVSPLQRFSFEQGIPEGLQPLCQVKQGLICRNVPTGAQKAGAYVFELAAIALGSEGEPADTKKTDTVKVIAPEIPARILAFQVNGQPAQAKYAIPIDPKQGPKALSLSWQVAGGDQTKVQLMPAPGNVPLQGAIAHPISQQPGSETLTLTVTEPNGQSLSRSVTIQTFNPNPLDPAKVAAEAAAAAAAAREETATDEAPPSPKPGAPVPADPNAVSPAELPPQFN